MGSDKADLLWKGRTFLQTVVASREVIFQECLVVGKPAPADWCSGNAAYHEDVRKDCGPLGGIYTALLVCQSPWALFVSCDTPLADRLIYEKVCLAKDEEFRRIVAVESSDGRWGNFPLLIPKTYIRTVRNLLDAGEKSVKSLLQESLRTAVALDAQEARKIRSINTPQDYEQLMGKGHELVA